VVKVPWLAAYDPMLNPINQSFNVWASIETNDVDIPTGYSAEHK
jgi:hypothetical protein